MARAFALVFLSISLLGCGESNKGDRTDQLSLVDIKKEISILQNNQKNYKSKFDYSFEHLKLINKQFPKLHDLLQEQTVVLSKNNNDLLEQINNNLKQSFTSIHNHINSFGESVAKAGY